MTLREIFSSRVYVGHHLYPAETVARMRDVALETSRELNPLGRPWTWRNRDSILKAGAFDSLVADLLRVVARCYGCGPLSITAREVIVHRGEFVPFHAEDAHLSAIYFVDTDARPDPDIQDYSGAFVLSHPGGPFGSRTLPWEGPRTDLILPKVGDLIVFPSYLGHHSFVYNGERPSVEIHFELMVYPINASSRQGNT
jgi:hypothetical protein